MPSLRKKSIWQQGVVPWFPTCSAGTTVGVLQYFGGSWTEWAPFRWLHFRALVLIKIFFVWKMSHSSAFQEQKRHSSIAKTLYIVKKECRRTWTNVTKLPCNSILFNWTLGQLNPRLTRTMYKWAVFNWTLAQLNTSAAQPYLT